MMPSQLFVDSEEEFESQSDCDDDDGNGDSDNDGVEDNESNLMGDDDEDAEDTADKGKKRKKNQKDLKKSKKLKKLGPKEAKKGNKDKLTTEEIKELTAKEYAQYSNLYNVQIEEVLGETNVPEKRKMEAKEWLKEFKQFLKGLSKSKKFLVKDYKKKLNHVQLPLPQQIITGDEDNEGKDGSEFHKWMQNQKLQWLPPTSVDIRGSWSTNTAIHKVSCLDVFVEMPYDYLVKSDTLNHKYHLKRAIYLAFLAKKLKERQTEDSDFKESVKFSVANGERLKPVIKMDVNNKLVILIHAVPPKDFFSSKKLACDKNNLRYGHFFKSSKDEDEPESSTQHYNLTILQDALVSEIEDEITEFVKNRPQIQNAIKLLKIWLTQRELSKAYGGYSGFIVTQLTRYLYSLGRINERMSAFQIIRIIFINLIQMDLAEKGISFSSNNPEQMRSAHMQWDIVFLDSTGYLNFTGNVSKYTYARVQQEARRALSMIDDGNTAGFSALFLTKVKFPLNFDHIIRIADIDDLATVFEESDEHSAALLDHSGYLYPCIVATVGPLIEKTLRKRISMMDCQLPVTPEWEATESAVATSNSSIKIRFGLIINRELSLKVVEKCEAESEEEISDFKSFWGDKSELRRFKDGTLLETVVLENLISGYGQSRVCFQMLKYIFEKHLNYTLQPNEYIDRQVETLVESKYTKVLPPSQKPISSKKPNKIYLKGKLAKKKMFINADKGTEVTVYADDISRQASNSFDELSKILRQLNDLPLQISTVQATSPIIRFSHIHPSPPQTYFQSKLLTYVHPNKNALLIKLGKKEQNDKKDEERQDNFEPETITLLETGVGPSSLDIPEKLPKYVEPIGVIIHLETSGQWPDNLQAIDRLKCAFLIKIGDLLGSKYGLTVQPYPRYLDILKDGFVFRLKITYFRELTLLKELRGLDGILRIRDNPESLRLEKEVLILPQLTSTLHSFHLQYEAFGKTCRIAKRWIASQLLLASPLEYNRSLEDPDCRLTEEAVEILVASLFINYAPHLMYPSEAHVGFQRFLYFLANTNFQAVPIIVNFNDKLSSEEIAAIELEFVKMRTTLPSLFISMPFDKHGSVWTRALSPVILGRVQFLAKKALSVIDRQNDNESGLGDLTKLFRPATNQFDVIIKLKKPMNPRVYQCIESVKTPLVYHEYNKKVGELLPVVDFDPVQLYLQELRRTFSHLAIFLHDSYGGQFIAVVWKPDIFKGVNFTNTTIKGRQLSKNGKGIIENVQATLESFQVMGTGLVESLQVQSDKWKFDE